MRKIEKGNYKVSYEIQWNDDISRHVAVFQGFLKDGTPHMAGFVLTDDSINEFGDYLISEFEYFLFINFIQTVKEKEASLNAQHTRSPDPS